MVKQAYKKIEPHPLEKQQHSRAALSDWFEREHERFSIALNLTFKQVLEIKTPLGTYKRRLTREDAEKLIERYMTKLNRQFYGRRAADKKIKSLLYIPVIEGKISKKRLHAHLSIGGFPSNISNDEILERVIHAKSLVNDIDKKFKVKSKWSSGWHSYIAKEAGRFDTDNVCWNLVNM